MVIWLVCGCRCAAISVLGVGGCVGCMFSGKQCKRNRISGYCWEFAPGKRVVMHSQPVISLVKLTSVFWDTTLCIG